MKVNRETYLAELKARMHNGLVKILAGVRRSGKSGRDQLPKFTINRLV